MFGSSSILLVSNDFPITSARGDIVSFLAPVVFLEYWEFKLGAYQDDVI